MTERFTPKYNKLTVMQKLMAFKNAFYTHVVWQPKPGDYYTTTREDMELYMITGIEEGKVYTIYTNPVSAETSWDQDGFTTKDFGHCRMHVPLWVLEKIV
jgi:hypothetical protein